MCLKTVHVRIRPFFGKSGHITFGLLAVATFLESSNMPTVIE